MYRKEIYQSGRINCRISEVKPKDIYQMDKSVRNEILSTHHMTSEESTWRHISADSGLCTEDDSLIDNTNFSENIGNNSTQSFTVQISKPIVSN